MTCSPRVAYDKCKRSRVDEAIREVSVFLLTHIYIHPNTHTHAHVYIHKYTYTHLRTYDNVRVTLMKLVLGTREEIAPTSRKWIRKWDSLGIACALSSSHSYGQVT